MSAVLILLGVGPRWTCRSSTPNFAGYVLWSGWLVAFGVVLLVTAPASARDRRIVRARRPGARLVGQTGAVADDSFAALGERLVAQVVEFGIRGVGPLSTAVQTAEEHLITAGGDREAAVQRLIATHVRLAAATGFVTGLGGFVTLPVTVPAAMAGLYIIATRMTAGIAHLRGYDVETDEVRSGILVALLGSAGAAVLRNTGVQVGQRSTAAALQRLPGRVLTELNRRVGYRLVTKAGEKGVINLTKLVPLVGGPIGAAVDGVSCKTIAGYAMRTFPPVVPRDRARRGRTDRGHRRRGRDGRDRPGLTSSGRVAPPSAAALPPLKIDVMPRWGNRRDPTSVAGNRTSPEEK